MNSHLTGIQERVTFLITFYEKRNRVLKMPATNRTFSSLEISDMLIILVAMYLRRRQASRVANPITAFAIVYKYYYNGHILIHRSCDI